VIGGKLATSAASLGCVEVCGNVLQRVAACCSLIGTDTATSSAIRRCAAARCSALQRVAVCCSVLHCVAVRYSVLHHISMGFAANQPILQQA